MHGRYATQSELLDVGCSDREDVLANLATCLPPTKEVRMSIVTQRAIDMSTSDVAIC